MKNRNTGTRNIATLICKVDQSDRRRALPDSPALARDMTDAQLQAAWKRTKAAQGKPNPYKVEMTRRVAIEVNRFAESFGINGGRL